MPSSSLSLIVAEAPMISTRVVFERGNGCVSSAACTSTAVQQEITRPRLSEWYITAAPNQATQKCWRIGRFCGAGLHGAGSVRIVRRGDPDVEHTILGCKPAQPLAIGADP